MTTAAAPAERPTVAQAQADNTNLPAIAGPRLPYHPAIEERFGIDRAGWKALVEAIFPNATTVESVILALSYCRARKLDPFKRNVHIVAIWDKERRRYTDTVWPGIGELRTTAFRTGKYAGRGRTVFGPDITRAFSGTVGRQGQERQVTKEVTFPEWAEVTVYRMVGDQRVEFVGPKVYWLETYATIGASDVPNDMWTDRPRGQSDKCAEAAALRCAFPEEIGSEYIPEEVQHGGRKVVANEALDALPSGRSSFKEADGSEAGDDTKGGEGAASGEQAGQTFTIPEMPDPSVKPGGRFLYLLKVARQAGSTLDDAELNKAVTDFCTAQKVGVAELKDADKFLALWEAFRNVDWAAQQAA